MTLKKALDSLIGAVGLFTVLPVPARPILGSGLPLLLCYPPVGALIGGLWFGLWRLCALAGLSPRLSGALLCLFPWLISGFMHMDGFMDVTDALLSSRSPEKRLEILKDPHAGAFSVCAAICLAVLQAAACTDMAERGGDGYALLFLPIFSRSLAALCLVGPPLLPGSSLGRALGGGAGKGAKLWFALCAAAALGGLLGSATVAVPLASAAGGLLALMWALRDLGGTSGDVAGFCLVAAEAAGLIALSLQFFL